MLALLTLLMPLLAAQGGYDTRKYPQLGIEMPVARDFERATIPAGMRYIELYFTESEEARKKHERRLPAVMFVLVIDGEPQEEGKPGEPVVTSFERYLEVFHGTWELGRSEPGRERDGYQGRIVKAGKVGDPGEAWAYVYEREQPTRRTVALMGYGHRADLESLTAIWLHIAERMRFSEPEPVDLSKLERLYERKPYPDVDFRIRVRARLAEPWTATDTEDYLILSSDKNKGFQRKVTGAVEALRPFVAATLPAEAERRTGLVRICSSADEYKVYGGIESWDVLWNPNTDELVVVDGSDLHEDDRFMSSMGWGVCLQYLSGSELESIAHPWFINGYGAYFGGARISGKRVNGVRPNPRYVEAARSMARQLEFVPWREFAADGGGAAQAWAMIYFLEESKAASKRDDWAGIKTRYLETLSSAYAEAPDREDAVAHAREAALEAAFGPVDLRELEEAWREFIGELKL